MRAAQQQKRQRLQWSIGIVALVVVGVVVLVLAKGSKSSDSNSPSTSQSAKPAPASIAPDLAKVSLPAVADAAKAWKANPDPSFDNPVKPITSPSLTENGKPEVLYIGGEYCPFCAGERWALTVALSKFGKFSNLKVLNSSEENVPTLSYVGSNYTSKYVTFTPIEQKGQNQEPLEKTTASQDALLQKYGGGSYPFIDFGGKYLQSGGSVDPKVLIGKEQTAIARTLAESKSTGTQVNSIPGQVNSTAAGFIKSICALTGGRPGNVCSANSQG